MTDAPDAVVVGCGGPTRAARLALPASGRGRAARRRLVRPASAPSGGAACPGAGDPMLTLAAPAPRDAETPVGGDAA